MTFKGEPVWVRVDDRGRPVLDAAGRAEMKYRQEDGRSYHPSAANLAAVSIPASPAPTATGDTVMVWTDGACSGNPGPMGIGVVALADGRREERSEYLGTGTNNIAELVAIERGVELADRLAPGRPVALHSDSGYAIGVLSKGWKAKANQDLVRRLRAMLGSRPHVSLVKVAGHAGVVENERCDELARRAVATRGRG